MNLVRAVFWMFRVYHPVPSSFHAIPFPLAWAIEILIAFLCILYCVSFFPWPFTPLYWSFFSFLCISFDRSERPFDYGLGTTGELIAFSTDSGRSIKKYLWEGLLSNLLF
ncbi:hypothetical protein BJ508DRAFT_137545 [Ascobolus immersus RN42]|uniref:Uncharacterized protein n=1 Tax=Ascobolus immersus RN42 TaxID=1160509 RepID=A0A3N4I2P1_ASCIM|nr:hypothetical protein BJ508DRAFT_137545 [Ascobolus immersus RN42]